jgi:hypothetical protein
MQFGANSISTRHSSSNEREEPVLRSSYFIRVKNIGDRIAPLVLQYSSCRSGELCRSLSDPHIVSIGSIFSAVNKHSYVWGTGVMGPEYGIGNPDPDRILAVRGKLSYSALVQSGLTLHDIPLGDPGFLAPQLFEEAIGDVPVSHKLGFVPHYVDINHPYTDRRTASRLSTYVIRRRRFLGGWHLVRSLPAPRCMGSFLQNPWAYRICGSSCRIALQGPGSNSGIGFH